MIFSWIKGQPRGASLDSLTVIISCASKKKNQWLVKCVSQLLYLCVMLPNGVFSLMFKTLSTDQSDSGCKKVIHILTTPPQQTSKKKYFAAIGPQLADVMNTKNSNSLKINQIVETVVLTIARMLNQEQNLCLVYVLQPILSPLFYFIPPRYHFLACRSFNLTKSYFAELLDHTPQGVIVSAEDFECCLLSICRLSKGNASKYWLKVLKLVIPGLFKLYVFTHKSPYFLKNEIKGVLATFLKLSKDGNKVLKSLIFPEEENCPFFFSRFEDGIQVEFDLSKGVNVDFEQEVSALVEVVTEVGGGMLANFFIDLLQHFVSATKDLDMSPENFRMLGVVAALGSHMDSCVLDSPCQLLTLLNTLLQRDFLPIIQLSLSIISLIIDHKLVQLDKASEILFVDMLARLRELGGHEDSEVSTIAQQLHVKISARDSSWFNESEDIESEDNKTLDSILKELQDPLLPIRAGGLINLRRFVLKKSLLVDCNSDKIISIFETQLNDEDTYVYGAAINGLGAVGDLYPDKVFPILEMNFLNEEITENNRLKTGEALVKISQRCGETLSFHASHLVDTFLKGCKSDVIGVRASSLSNLATICELINFAVHPYVVEIVSCVQHILQTDKEDEVIRGGLFLLLLLFEALDVEVFELIPTQIKGLYRLLQSIKQHSSDEVSIFHCTLALKQIDQIILKVLGGGNDNPENHSKLKIIK